MKAFVSAWVGSNNLGDEIIFEQAVRLLKRHGIEVIYTASNSPAVTSVKYDVKACGYFQFIQQFRYILDSDVFVFGPGGLIQDETSIWNIPFHFVRLWIAKLLRKPVFVVGVGVGPLRKSFSRWLVRKSLQNCEWIVVRDSDSRNLLEQCGIMGAEVASDIVFSEQPDDDVSENPLDEGYLIVSLRPFKGQGGLLPASLKRVPDSGVMVEVFAQQIARIAKETERKIIFLSFDKDKDTKFHESIMRAMGDSYQFEHKLCKNTTEAAALFSAAYAVIGMRYHACALSIIHNKPLVMIAYTKKVKSLGGLFDSKNIIGNTPGELASLHQAYHLCLPKTSRVERARHILLEKAQLYGTIGKRMQESIGKI